MLLYKLVAETRYVTAETTKISADGKFDKCELLSVLI
jgi:hypothetical protein